MFFFFFYSNANKTHFHQTGFALTLVLKVRVLEVGNPKSPAGVEFLETAPKFRKRKKISSSSLYVLYTTSYHL